MCYEGEQQEEMGTGHYLATLLLFAIPVVGLIMMITGAFAAANGRNARSWPLPA